MIPFIPKAGPTPAARWPEGSFSSCFTRGEKKSIKRDLPESQSSHSEPGLTSSLQGSAKGTGGAPCREGAQWSGTCPAGGALEPSAAWRRADKENRHISGTLLEQEGFFLILCSQRCPPPYYISATVEQDTKQKSKYGKKGSLHFNVKFCCRRLSANILKAV